MTPPAYTSPGQTSLFEIAFIMQKVQKNPVIGTGKRWTEKEKSTVQRENCSDAKIRVIKKVTKVLGDFFLKNYQLGAVR